MNILYDNIIFSLQKSGGISVMWAELIKRALKTSDDISFVEYENAATNLFRGALDIPERSIRMYKNKALKVRRYFPLRVKIKGNTIFHSSYYRTVLQPNVANITTVHDFIYDFYRKGLARLVNVSQQKQALEKSDLIICVSERTKADLLQLHPRVQADKIKVIHHGVSDDFYRLYDEDHTVALPFAEQSYVMYVGDRTATYKCFAPLIRSFPKHKNFVIAGGGAAKEYELELLNKYLGPGRYKFTGYVSNSVLNELYNNAYALIYPSLYEGFGMPVLEAQKAGCPVIALNRSSIPEVAGNGAILLEALSNATINESVEKLNEAVFRKGLVEHGLRNAEKFSWDITFNNTVSAYREVWKNKFLE